MLTFLIRTFLEELSKAMKSLVVTVEISCLKASIISNNVASSTHCHGEINVASIEFHVDLLIDQGFTLLMIVLADLGTHLDVEDVVVVVDVIEVYVKS